tara:strand:- start:5095 stop:6825 length:1731 start_codon:yes stop_codon:yes gene_type:complete
LGQATTPPNSNQTNNPTDPEATAAAKNFAAAMKQLKDDLQGAVGALADYADRTAEFSANTLEMSNSFSKQLTGLDAVVGKQQEMGKALIEINKRATVAERRYASLNKTFGLTGIQANALGKQFNEQANDLGISAANSMKYGAAIKKLLPTIRTMEDSAGRASLVNEDFFKSLSTVQRVITTNMGLSEQAAERFTYFSTNQEQSASDVLQQAKATAEAIDDATGTQGSFAMITEEIGNTSEDVLLQFGRMPGKLELAVMKGKALGLSLTEVTKIGMKMLDIESSIGAELEYQLLSGQRLTNSAGESLTNKFREAALSGDANQQAETLNELLETQGDVLNDNVLARQKMADLLGMDEASLSRALMKRKLLEKEGAEVLMNLSGDDFEAAAKQMLESGQLSEKTFKELQGLGDQRTTDAIMEEQLAVQLDQLALAQLDLVTNEKFEANRNSLVEKFETNLGKLKGDDLQSAGAAVRAYEGAMASIGFATSGITAKYDQKIESAEDLLYIPGQETSTGKYGDLFKLDPRDGVAAGPPAAIAAAAGGGSSTLHIDYDKLAAAMSNVKLEVTVDPKASKFAS